jgi:hypothetical protein
VSIFESFDTIIKLDGLGEVQITQDKVMESLCALDVTDSRTSGLGTTFLKCQAVSGAGLSRARLKDFYCTYMFTLLCCSYCFHSYRVY